MKPILRFAPSPTGLLSFGNARTALFNYLYAKANNGQFLLRIEDTDESRSKKDLEEPIFRGLSWLGLHWDNKDIPRQSERKEIYKKYLEKLISEKKAYHCFCDAETLEKDKEAQIADGLSPKYRGPCRTLSESETQKLLESKNSVIRFKMPEKIVEIPDLIRGRIKTDLSLIGDIVIAKDLLSPLYNFAVVIDDYEFKITHVLRGEDHLSNTPKQWAIAESLGLPHPEFGHLPVILGPDKKKLSKRFLQGSLSDYEKKGYLKEAVINFLLLIGWHPKADREIISLDEAINEFSLDRVQKSGGIFNPDKLDWYNTYYIKNIPIENLLKEALPFIKEDWRKEKDKLTAILEVERSRLKYLEEFNELAAPYFTEQEYQAKLLVWKDSTKESAKESLIKCLELITESPNELLKEHLEKEIMALADKKGRGEVLWPLRVALSGREKSAGPFDIIKVLGKHESMTRLESAIAKLK